MREYEKMVSGQVYNPANLLLQIKQIKARTLCEKYNRIGDNKLDKANEKKKRIIKRLFGSCENNTSIQAPFMCDFGENIYIKDKVSIESNCVFLDTARIEIGNNVSIGHDTCLACVSHLLHPDDRKKCKNFSKPIIIEDNVIIGSNVTILGGVTIGKGSRIQDGTIVSKNVYSDDSSKFVVSNVLSDIKNEIKVELNNEEIDDINKKNYNMYIVEKLNKTYDFRYIKRFCLFKKIFASVCPSTLIMSPFNCYCGKNIYFKGKTFINYNCKIIATDKIEIDDNILVGPGTCITCVTYDSFVKHNVDRINKPIKIGKNVWIGANVTIFGGVTIGDNSVIGAGSVVTKDIPEGVVAYGNPCTKKRKILDSDKRIK